MAAKKLDRTVIRILLVSIFLFVSACGGGEGGSGSDSSFGVSTNNLTDGGSESNSSSGASTDSTSGDTGEDDFVAGGSSGSGNGGSTDSNSDDSEGSSNGDDSSSNDNNDSGDGSDNGGSDMSDQPPAVTSQNARFAPVSVNITDDFSNNTLTDADTINGFWSAYSDANVTVSEAAGDLDINSSGADYQRGGIRTDNDYRLNFFSQPIQVVISDIDISGSINDPARQQMFVALTSSSESSISSEDSIVLRLQGDGGIALAWKVDSAGADEFNEWLLFDSQLAQTPNELSMTFDRSSYSVVAKWANESRHFSGQHSIPFDSWGQRGDSSLSIEARRDSTNNAGTNARVRVGNVKIVALNAFDEFENDEVSDASYSDNYWSVSSSSSGTQIEETQGGLVITNSGSGNNPHGGISSPVSKRFNFFAQSLVFSGRLALEGNVSAGGIDIARFGVSSSALGTVSSDSAMALTFNANNRVNFGWKTGSPGSLAETTNVVINNQQLPAAPTHFELALSKRDYELTVYWDGGSRDFSGSHNINWFNWSSTGNASVSLEGRRQSSNAADIAEVRWEKVVVERDQGTYLASTVFGPIGDGVDLEVPRLDESHELAQWGLVDVTKPPFNADPMGQEDSTQALQHAIDFARQHFMVTYLPTGTYKVSDTLSCAQSLVVRTSDNMLNDPERPCVMQGSRQGNARPKIYLAPNSTGFDNPGSPKYVVHYWARGYNATPQDPQPNISFNQMFVNIDIEVGENNPGAIGIRHRAAQGSAIQESTIDVTHGFAGVDAAAGSGGSHSAITVIGGQYGLYLLESQPAPTITGMTLTGQTVNAILYGGRQALTAVGIKIEVPSNIRGPAIRVNGRAADRGQISLVDSEINFLSQHANNTAISTDSSIYLHNVYFRNATQFVDVRDSSNDLPGTASGWRRVNEYANGVTPPLYSVGGGTYQYQTPVYLNGVRSTTDIIDLGGTAAPPADLQSQHLWGDDFPSWESAGAVNVKLPPYNATGDGVTDDTAAIQQAINDNEIVYLPKGNYRISSTLQLQANTKLVGISRTLSSLITERDGIAFSNPSNPQPLVRTANNANAETVLAFIKLHASSYEPGAYALHWRSGGESIVRAVNFIRHSDYGYGGVPGKGSATDAETPFVRVTNNGGGKWYNFFQEAAHNMAPSYRHMLIDGTSNQLNFYQFNPEHAQGEANSEVRNASNVNFYGIKSESNFVVLWIRDSNHISMFGYGGNAPAFSNSTSYPSGFEQFTPSLFRVERTPNYRLVQLMDTPRVTGGHPVFGIGVDPLQWHMMLENYASQTTLSDVLDRPVLVKRGSPQ